LLRPLYASVHYVPVIFASTLLFARFFFSFSSSLRQLKKFFNNMPSTTTIEKIQPWKAHWPAPAKQESGIEYGVQKGEVVVVDGTSAKVSVAKNDGTISAADKQAK
jgi:hypothetical protein